MILPNTKLLSILRSFFDSTSQFCNHPIPDSLRYDRTFRRPIEGALAALEFDNINGHLTLNIKGLKHTF